MSSDIDIFVLVYVINILVYLAPLLCWKSSGCVCFFTVFDLEFAHIIT